VGFCFSQPEKNFSYISLFWLNKNTAPKIKIIPQADVIPSLSLKNTTLNTVADIGSIIPNADAVPAGNVLRENVYKKYGSTQVHMPRPKSKSSIAGEFVDIIWGILTGLHTKKAITVAKVKQ